MDTEICGVPTHYTYAKYKKNCVLGVREVQYFLYFAYTKYNCFR